LTTIDELLKSFNKL